MDLRNLPAGLRPDQRIALRRERLARALKLDLGILTPMPETIGEADQKNCEQMIGAVPVPVGYAGPLRIQFSNSEHADIHLPLATTEGALVASVNRGCKALTQAGGVRIEKCIHHGVTRSLGFRLETRDLRHEQKRGFPNSRLKSHVSRLFPEWKSIGESTSSHLTILHHDLDEADGHLFLTIACDSGEAMGMNMVTIAAQAIGQWIEEHIDGITFVTVAANVDSDKKPSQRTHDLGRGYEVIASAVLPETVIASVLKAKSLAMLAAADAKLKVGSKLAGAIGSNLHAANVVAALYLATGQDTAHVVEGSLADTEIIAEGTAVLGRVRLPALLVGIRGGGTTLPTQAKCLELLLQPKTKLHRRQQLAESIAAAALAGEFSLLAAQASHTLAKTHQKLARTSLANNVAI